MYGLKKVTLGDEKLPEVHVHDLVIGKVYYLVEGNSILKAIKDSNGDYRWIPLTTLTSSSCYGALAVFESLRSEIESILKTRGGAKVYEVDVETFEQLRDAEDYIIKLGVLDGRS